MLAPTVIFGICGLATVLAKIPSYIHVCKRNDPQLNQCIINSVQALEPHLLKGIPELDIPPVDPLSLDGFVFEYGGRMVKLRGTDFVVRGGKNYEILDLKTDLAHDSFQIKVNHPRLVLDSSFEVTGKFLSLNIHGKGPVSVVLDDAGGNVIVKAKRVEKDGKQYFIIDSMDLKLKLKNYEVKLSDGFFKDPAVTEAINAAIHENKKEIINLIRPRVEGVIKDVLLDIAAKITRNFTYDELFPEK